MKKHCLLVFFIALLGLTAKAQEDQAYNLKTFNFKPTIGLGIGMMNYYGDISRNDRTNNPLISDIGYDLRVSFPLYRGFDIYFNAMLGSVSANEISTTRNLNFRSTIYAGGIAAAYNFDHFLPEERLIDPYVKIGFESVEFISKTDLRDEVGNTYHYWSDGTIRNLPESPENEAISTRLSRDYVYETDIRSLNADGFGDYSEQAWAMPVGVGGNLHLTEKIDLRLGFTMHFLFSDYLEGITDESIGVRQGNPNNDKFLYSSFSISYNLSNSPSSFLGLSKKDMRALDIGDEDDDGVIDFDDKCPHTPKGASVDKMGCPLDSDGDGVPDYKDLEANTADTAVVDSLGRSMTPEQLAEAGKEYFDTTGSGGEFADTSFAVELTDKTNRPTTKGTKPSGTATPTKTGETSTLPKTDTKPVSGLNLPEPKVYEGVVYRVQIMATKAKPATNPFPQVQDLSASQFNDGYYRFFSGNYTTREQAESAKKSLETQGISGAFVRIFENGKLLPIGKKPTGAPANITPGETQPSETPQTPSETTEPTETGSTEPLPSGDFELPSEMDPNKFKFRVLLGAYQGNAPEAELSKFEQFGPVDTDKRNGKTYIYMGEFPELNMAKRFQDELKAEGLKNLEIQGEYDGKVLEEEEFNRLFK